MLIAEYRYQQPKSEFNKFVASVKKSEIENPK